MALETRENGKWLKADNAGGVRVKSLTGTKWFFVNVLAKFCECDDFCQHNICCHLLFAAQVLKFTDMYDDLLGECQGWLLSANDN
jgi:hypothetical protein